MPMKSIPAEEKDATPAYSGRIRYTPKKADDYQRRATGRHKSEMRLIENAFRLVPRGSVLDAPCGGGRVGLWLAQQGYMVTVADLSESMLEITRKKVAAQSLPITVEHQDVECLRYEAKSFDAVISFRLFHHFPNTDIRARVVGELCRVARRRAEIFFFGGAAKKHPTSLSEVRGYFQTHGFQLVRDFAQTPFFHTLHLAVFERVT
jgi:ubiquinone/menaquinone biosynthesis C-methylase UbiE